MTTPATTQQPSQAADVQLGLAAAGVLATATSVSVAAAALAPTFLAAGVGRKALTSALEVVMSMPPDRQGFYGPATSYVSRLNLARRAQFLVASSRRLHTVAVTARSHGQGITRALLGQLGSERRYYGQHMQAIWQRSQAAARIDSASMLYGNLLGWNTVLTPTTTRECLAADGKNFYADHPPSIGWPGMAHPGCRCWPGAPVPGAPMVGSRAPRVRQPVYA
jgi:hypothetical protein